MCQFLEVQDDDEDDCDDYDTELDEECDDDDEELKEEAKVAFIKELKTIYGEQLTQAEISVIFQDCIFYKGKWWHVTGSFNKQ